MTAQEAINTAYKSGARAGKAMKERDQARATFEREWFRKFKAIYQGTEGLQSGELEVHYGDGYRSETMRSEAEIRARNYGI